MLTISINFQVPQGWHELGDKQLRYDTASLLCSSCKIKNSCDRHSEKCYQPVSSQFARSLYESPASAEYRLIVKR